MKKGMRNGVERIGKYFLFMVLLLLFMMPHSVPAASEAEIAVGEETRFRANTSSSPYRWSVSDESVLSITSTVGQSCTVRGLRPGTAKVIVSYSKLEYNANKVDSWGNVVGGYVTKHKSQSWNVRVTEGGSNPPQQGSEPVVLRPQVRFDANGGVCPVSALSVSNQKLASLPEATREGYDFEGWYTSKTGGSKITLSTVFRENITVYAHWKLREYTVTFDASGGSCKTSKMTTVNRKLPNLPNAERKGYIFEGWYTMQSGGMKITSSSTVYVDLTLYAHWTLQEYTVTFDACGGVCTSAEMKTVGQKLLSLPEAERNGYKFEGWYTLKHWGGYEITRDFTFGADQTVYARWSSSGYESITATLNTEGGLTADVTAKIPAQRISFIEVAYGEDEGQMSGVRVDEADPDEETSSFTLTCGWPYYELKPGAVYYYQCSFQNEDGENVRSKIGTFTTPGVSDIGTARVKSPRAGELKVSFQAMDGVVDGYQVQYARNKKFTKPVKKDISSTKKSIYKTYSGLKPGANYYVRVRAYYINGANTKKFGSWSKVLPVTVKKKKVP